MHTSIPCTLVLFSSGGEGGDRLTVVFSPFRLAVIMVYYIFQQIIHRLSHANIPPFKISLENTLNDLFKTLPKAYQAKALTV